MGKHLASKVASIRKASPAEVAKYAARATTNVAQGTLALKNAGRALSQGDVKGAVVEGHRAANKIIGKKNIKAASNVIVGKKATQAISKGVRVVNRADKAYGQFEKGDYKSAAKTALGKKATDSVSDRMTHHVARAKHHSDRVSSYHAASTGRVADAIGGV